MDNKKLSGLVVVCLVVIVPAIAAVFLAFYLGSPAPEDPRPKTVLEFKMTPVEDSPDEYIIEHLDGRLELYNKKTGTVTPIKMMPEEDAKKFQTDKGGKL